MVKVTHYSAELISTLNWGLIVLRNTYNMISPIGIGLPTSKNDWKKCDEKKWKEKKRKEKDNSNQ